MATTVTSKGQVTIPKRVRDQLGLKAGTKVEFVLVKGHAVIEPVGLRGADALAGSLRAYAKALAINPRSASALYSKAESEYALSRWREAEASYRTFVELNAAEFTHLLPCVRERLADLHSKVL